MRKTITKKADLTSKPAKYYMERLKGKNKKESAIAAGYADYTHTTSIEASKSFQEVRSYFKDELLKQTTVSNLATELLKNIEQDEDRGAKNKAIEIALSKIEPDKVMSEEDERVVVILKS